MRLLLFLLVAGSFQFAHAQNRFDVFYLGGHYNAISNSPGEINKNYEASLTGNLSIPLFLKDSSIWYNSVDFQYYDVNTPFSGSSSLERLQLQGLILRTGYVYPLNEKHSWQVLFVPRLMGDRGSKFADRLQLGGMVLYETKKSKDLKYSIGLLYNKEFFGPYFVPLFQINWQVSPKFRINGLLPIYAKFAYQATKKIGTGFHFFGLTTTYHVSDPVAFNSYIDRRSIDLSLFGSLNLGGNLFLETRLGYSLVRDYALYNGADQVNYAVPLAEFGAERQRQNLELGSSPFVHVRLTYSVPVN